MNAAAPRRDPLQLELDSHSMKRRTVRGAGVTAVAQGVKFCLQMVTQIVLARFLDPAQFGLVAMVAPVLGLVLALNDSGLGQAIVQRRDLTHRQVSSMFWINAGIGLTLTAVVVALAPLVAWGYDEPRTAGVAVASASLILLSSLGVVPLALLSRQMRFSVLAAVEVAGMAAGLASGIVAAWWGAGYWALVIMQAVNVLTALVLGWALCGWRPGWPAIEPGVGALMRFGAHVMGANLAAQVSMSASQAIVGVVNGHVALGLYDRSYNLVAKPLMQLMAPASRVAVPLLARLHDTHDAVPGRTQGRDARGSPSQGSSAYTRAYLLMLQLTTVACVPGLIAAACAAEPLIGLLLGPKWQAMVPVFFWIGMGALLAPLSSSTFWLFATQGRAAEQMRFSVASAAIGITAFAIGSQWGVVAVARLSALAFIFLQTPLLVWAATRQGPVRLATLHRALVPLAVAAAVTTLAVLGLLQMLVAPRWLLLVATFGLAYGVFVLLLWLQPAGRQLLVDARATLARPAPLAV